MSSTVLLRQSMASVDKQDTTVRRMTFLLNRLQMADNDLFFLSTAENELHLILWVQDYAIVVTASIQSRASSLCTRSLNNQTVGSNSSSPSSCVSAGHCRYGHEMG
jgi:hypothetical protein